MDIAGPFIDNWSDIITALVALYGAIVSTYYLYDKFNASRSNIKTGLSWGFLTFADGSVSREAYIFIEASNHGSKTVTLNHASILLPDKRNVILSNAESNVKYPYELMPGKSCKIWIEVRKLAESTKFVGYKGKIPLIGYYEDELGKSYYSKKLMFDVNGKY